MEASISPARSLKPSIDLPNIFLKNGSTFNVQESTRLTSSRINHVLTLHGLQWHRLRQYKTVLACGAGSGSQSFGSLHRLNLRNDAFKQPPWQASRSHCLKLCQVKSEDSEGTLSGESIILNEQTLEQELQTAVREENYAQAAKIRDSLKLLQEDSKASVLAANARFYNAFRNGDLAGMQTLWSRGDHVCVVHPGVSGISGYDLVMGSWEFVWGDYEFPLDIEIKDVEVHVRGDVGYVKCIEMVRTKGSSWGKQFATNVFEQIEGQWFMCVHHASYIDL